MKQTGKLFWISALISTATALLFSYAHASTFEYQGKEITKGEAVRILAKDPKAVVIKSDRVILDERRGTIKNMPKD